MNIFRFHYEDEGTWFHLIEPILREQGWLEGQDYEIDMSEDIYVLTIHSGTLYSYFNNNCAREFCTDETLWI
jgi:hypothetical protein